MENNVYEAPMVELVEFVVEEGFALSRIQLTGDIGEYADKGTIG